MNRALTFFVFRLREGKEGAFARMVAIFVFLFRGLEFFAVVDAFFTPSRTTAYFIQYCK